MPSRPTARLMWADRHATPPDTLPPRLEAVEVIHGDERPAPNRLLRGDNLAAMSALLADGLGGQVDLVYFDPPFVSRAEYAQTVVLPDGTAVRRPVFSDTWANLDAWLDMLYPRLRRVQALLADHGSLYVHLDWRAVHYARVLLDEVFGADAFRNEIVWKRAALLGRKAASRQYGRVTDSLLFYTKSDRFTFNRLTVERSVPRSEARWDEARGRWFRTAPPGDYTAASLAALDVEGRIHRTRSGRLRVKYFLDARPDGRLVDHAPLDNLWLDIPDMMHLPAAERTGYPTQKPLALLQRIVAVSSNPGDLVLDPFAGAGTTLLAAAGLGRRWLGIEASQAGVAVARARLLAADARPFAISRVAGSAEAIASSDAPAFRLSEQGVDLMGDSAEVEYWAVDWACDGEFRSAWQGWRGYGAKGHSLPTRAPAPAEGVSGPVAVRWERLDGREGALYLPISPG